MIITRPDESLPLGQVGRRNRVCAKLPLELYGSRGNMKKLSRTVRLLLQPCEADGLQSTRYTESTFLRTSLLVAGDSWTS